MVIAGGVGIGAERAVFQHPGIRGAAADRDRPVLLRQAELQESDGGGGAVGD